MKKILCIILIFSLFLLPISAIAEEFDLHTLFPNLVMGFDPEGDLDTVYITCGGVTATSVILEVRMKTDNNGSGNCIIATYMPLVITADKPGVTLDTTYPTPGPASWSAGKYVQSAGGNPSVFPMQLLVGGACLFDTLCTCLTNGDYLLANLKFDVSEPTNICIPDWYSSKFGGLLLVTDLANGYSPGFVGNCCGPFVPTLSEWGLILFGLVLFGILVWYLRKTRVKTAA
ncbi:MAG: hypothetical protein A2142_04090 [candidate division Zixibacteria bacterium RBG_16_48_11]|nr:MAG: hypothetical protein A2142_04090 [candidate division Zixibacteria bacterium RBG_16_48_11]